MNRIWLLVLPIALSLGCARSGKGGSLTIAGSTSVQPFAELLAEMFVKDHPKTRINVQGGGSSAGIQAVRAGACAIGTSSRELTPDEQSLYHKLIARDGIVIIVNPQNAVDDLTIDQILGIFTGRIKKWSEVGGNNRPITAITREEGSGTRKSFEEMVMGKEFFADEALVQDSNGAIREIVATDPDAISYISFGLIDPRVKPLKISGVMPTVEAMETGQYNLVRPFLFVTKTEPTGMTAEFIDFVLSPQAQTALKREGLIPVR